MESIAAYDIKPGAPEHPKGEANGYLITLGGKRIYFAGVTECVPEMLALKNIDVAFMPMNIPVERMTPAAAADVHEELKPKVVYVYHYDQDFATRAASRHRQAERRRQPREPGSRDTGLRERTEGHVDRVQARELVSEEVIHWGLGSGDSGSACPPKREGVGSENATTETRRREHSHESTKARKG